VWLLIALAISLPLYLYARAMAPPPSVHVRWAPSVDARERGALEARFHLAAGRFLEGRTWSYRITDTSQANVAAIISDPRVEDTDGVDRSARRISSSRGALDGLGTALALGFGAATLAFVGLALKRSQRFSTLGRRAWTALDSPKHVGVLLVWAAIAVPYVAVGPDDMEEYVTGAVTTKLAVDAIVEGSWPLWNVDLALGLPQPLRFHIITHPLSPLCTVVECHTVLRLVASLHLLVGSFFIALLARRFTGNLVLSTVAGVTYCLSSSFIQTMLVDDWSITAVNESALPVMLYAVIVIGDRDDRRHQLLWTLILAALSGLILSMSFPVTRLTILGLVGLSAPGLRRRFPWLLLAAGITLLIGGWQVHRLYEEFSRLPVTSMRTDHPDAGLGVHLWSVFLRPLSGDPFPTWRTIFFGPPFAVAAVAAAVALRAPYARVLRVGLLLGILGFIVPPAWLFNINTAQWTYRTEVNAFGILLAAYGIHRWTSRPGRAHWTPRIVAVQLCWVAIACVPVWYPVVARSIGLAPPARSTLQSPGVAEEIAAIYRKRAGRVVFAPQAYEALRGPAFNSAGLAPNQLPTLGVPTLSTVANGVTADDLYPSAATLEAEIKAEVATVQSRPLLDVLGIRYVVALGDEPVAAGLQPIRQLTDTLRLYENEGAWPEAFFVEALPAAHVPRLSTCPHDRFLCADFSRYELRRRMDRLDVTRFHDGFRLAFASSDVSRHIVITQWFREGWTITEGRASVTRAAEQLLGLEVAPGQEAVEVRFRPRLRQSLFATGVATEAVVGVAITALVFFRIRERRW
jgi:hypothetical protein